MATIVRCKPWTVLRGFQDQVQEIFDQNFSESCANTLNKWSPHVDVIEETDKYRLIADLPGVDPEAIKLKIENNVMIIQGERKSETKREKEGYFRIEREFGSFSRKFTLTENMDTSKIQAKSKLGVLEVTIPKLVSNNPKSVEIKVESEDIIR